MVRQLCLCSPWSPWGRNHQPMDAIPWSSLFLNECAGTDTGSSLRSAACGKDSYGRSLLRIVSCGSDPLLEQGRSEERLSSEWGRSSRDYMWTDHSPHLLYPTEGGGEREFGSEFEPQKRGGEGTMFSRFSFYFSLSYSDLISNKFNWFPHVKSGLPMTVGAEQSPCPYLDPWALFFLSLVQLKSGVINGFDGHLISSQGHPSTLLNLRAVPNARSWPLRAEISQHAVTQNCSWTSIFHLVFFLWS